MDKETHKKLHDLQLEVEKNVAVNDDVVCGLCDEIIALANPAKNAQALAFAYIWKADHSFYVRHDYQMLNDYLLQAQPYIDKRKPTKLLEKYYTLKKLFYEYTLDVRSGFQCCLNALGVCEDLQLETRLAVQYANLADILVREECFGEALEYNMKSLEMLENTENPNYVHIVIIYTNIITIFSKLNDPVSMKRYITRLEKAPLNGEDMKLYLDSAYIQYYSTLCDQKKTCYYIQKLLDDNVMEFPNVMFVTEFISHAINAAFKCKEKTFAKQLLSMLDTLIDKQNNTQKVDAKKMKAMYYEIFTEESIPSTVYHDFYVCYKDYQAQVEALKIAGMNARLRLIEAQRKQGELDKNVRSLEDAANIDQLTKVHNRRYMNYIQSRIINGDEYENIGFIIVDVDYFKEYNDFYGHASGDTVLQKVSSLLEENKLDNMVVCRYGGDEFVCICWNIQMHEMRDFVHLIKDKLTLQHIAHLHSKCADMVTLSIGYGCRPLPLSTSAFAFFDEVDVALYEAKKKGRNTFASITLK